MGGGRLQVPACNNPFLYANTKSAHFATVVLGFSVTHELWQNMNIWPAEKSLRTPKYAAYQLTTAPVLQKFREVPLWYIAPSDRMSANTNNLNEYQHGMHNWVLYKIII